MNPQQNHAYQQTYLKNLPDNQLSEFMADRQAYITQAVKDFTAALNTIDADDIATQQADRGQKYAATLTIIHDYITINRVAKLTDSDVNNITRHANHTLQLGIKPTMIQTETNDWNKTEWRTTLLNKLTKGTNHG